MHRLFLWTNRAETRGAELSLEYNPTDNYSLYLTYTRLSVDDKKDIFSQIDPKHTLTWGGTFRFNKAYLPSYIDAKARFVDTISVYRLDSPTALPTKVDPYIVCDIKIAKKFMDDNLEVAVTGLNLFAGHR